jgi:pimeloyl-ACP methyl ester carboxylesterase
MPPGDLAGVVVALPGASLGTGDQAMFDHLAGVVAPYGVAVLSYDRRRVDGHDTPLQTQLDDLRSECDDVRQEFGVPIGLFGFSQGAWVVVESAVTDEIANLTVVGHCAVSPAEQMRFHVDERLRRAGFDVDVRRRAGDLRLALERALRGHWDRAEVSRYLTAVKGEPWFGLTYLPETVEPDHHWDDMDHDPAAVIHRVRVPTLAIWGQQETVTPALPSRAAWASAPGEVTTVLLPGCGHWPTVGSAEPDAGDWLPGQLASPNYTHALATWHATVWS